MVIIITLNTYFRNTQPCITKIILQMFILLIHIRVLERGNIFFKIFICEGIGYVLQTVNKNNYVCLKMTCVHNQIIQFSVQTSFAIHLLWNEMFISQ